MSKKALSYLNLLNDVVILFVAPDAPMLAAASTELA